MVLVVTCICVSLGPLSLVFDSRISYLLSPLREDVLTWHGGRSTEGKDWDSAQQSTGERGDGGILHGLTYLPAAISVSQETKEDAGHHVAKKHHLESG